MCEYYDSYYNRQAQLSELDNYYDDTFGDTRPHNISTQISEISEHIPYTTHTTTTLYKEKFEQQEQKEQKDKIISNRIITNEFNYNKDIEDDIETIDSIMKAITVIKENIHRKNYKIYQNAINKIHKFLNMTHNQFRIEQKEFDDNNSSCYETDCDEDDDLSDYGDHTDDIVNLNGQESVNDFIICANDKYKCIINSNWVKYDNID